LIFPCFRRLNKVGFSSNFGKTSYPNRRDIALSEEVL
jgi:hypothetical protein